jgi:hypothetical protein
LQEVTRRFTPLHQRAALTVPIMTMHAVPQAASPGQGAPRQGEIPPTRRRRRTLRKVALVVVAVVLGVLVCAALLLRDALAARDALTHAAERLPAVEEAFVRAATDPRQAGALADSPELAELQRLTETARTSTDGPLWWVAARLPVVGATADSVTTVSSVLDDITDDVLPPLAASGDAVASIARTPDGGLDTTPLQTVAPRVHAAHDTLSRARDRLDGLRLEAVQTQLVEPVVTLRGHLDGLATVVATADAAMTLLPPMLGADEPRTYLLLGLNSGELRAGGGIPGALVLLRVDDGRVETVRQVSTAGIPAFAEPVLPLDPDDVALHSERLGRFVQHVTATPDFPTTAALAAQMWADAQGEQVDGVLATDPVALSHLLAATGPVEVSLPRPLAARLGRDTVEITSDNVVDVLVRQVYDVFEPQEADKFFAVVAAVVLDRVGQTDELAALVPAVRAAAEENRLRAWSATPQEQERLGSTALGGSFTSAAETGDAVGVFLDDTVSGKMSAYLDLSIEHTGSTCTPAGRVDGLRVRMRSTAPPDAARVLPWYVAGLPGRPGAPPGTLSLNVTVLGARDADAPRLQRDGQPFGGTTTTAHDRDGVLVTVVLAPGEETTLDVAVPAAPGPHGPTLDVWSTPTVTAPGLHHLAVPECG